MGNFYILGGMFILSYKDKDVLYRLYHEEQLTMTEIGRRLGCSGDTIREWLKKYNIPIRKYVSSYSFSPEEAIKLYLSGMSIVGISKKIGGFERSIRKVLVENGIELRDRSEAQTVAQYGKPINKKLKDKNWLYIEYIEKRRSAKEIAEEVGHDPKVVFQYLEKYNIPRRGDSEAKIGLLTGEKHPNWQGGKSSLNTRCRTFFQVNLVPKVLERDSYTCQNCLEHGGYKEVHHKIPFSKIMDIIIKKTGLHPKKDIEELYNIIINDELFLDLNNLITLCKKCHKLAHKKGQSEAKPQIEEGSTTSETTYNGRE